MIFAFVLQRLEEQMNDLIELHQNEIENLKQGIVDMEEKVQYQSEERLRDIYELLEGYQTRVGFVHHHYENFSLRYFKLYFSLWSQISRIEHQQQQQFQQLVNIDSLENSNARVFVLKLINVLLTFLQVILLIVATVASIIIPFIKTR